MLFRSLSPSKQSSVVLADGRSCPIMGHGSVSPISSLPLSSVNYIPNFPFSLLSVSQLTKSLNCSVTFYPSYCVFQDLSSKKMIGGGREQNGLYYLQPLPPQNDFVALSKVSPHQWHCRLGHPSLQSLQLVFLLLNS